MVCIIGDTQNKRVTSVFFFYKKKIVSIFYRDNFACYKKITIDDKKKIFNFFYFLQIFNLTIYFA